MNLPSHPDHTPRTCCAFSGPGSRNTYQHWPHEETGRPGSWAEQLRDHAEERLECFLPQIQSVLNNSPRDVFTSFKNYTLYFQKWLLADLRFPMTTFRVWGSRFMECPPGFPSTLPSSTTNSSSNRFWPIWKKLSS